MADTSKMIISGLTSQTTGVPAAGPLLVSVKLSLPTIGQGAPADSQVVTTVTQNSTTVYTSNAGDQGFELTIQASASDTITIALTSSAAVDQGYNVVKCVAAIG